uniref:Cw7 protein n=1 Tax=Davidia involucrata TaxID=16924 RepID=A0A5B7AZB6_DAVIN
MFGDGGETPTRYELLSMVKKHSNLLGKTIVDEQDASDVEMDARFWHDVMDVYFIRGRESRGRQDDDLIFFIRKMSLHGYGFNDNMEGKSPYFVRRWAPKLDNLVDQNSIDVDWRRSFYLNLIAHTSFSVTVAICSHRVLRNHQTGQDTPLSSIYKVVKTVYASPSRVDFHLDSRKEVETTPAYPDICFAIDDFDSTFDAVVLTETDHCYCVLLNAHDGVAFPSEKTPQNCSSSDISSLKINTDSGKTKNTKLTLFSGFVSYQMVREAYDAGKSGFGSLLSLGHSPGKRDRLYMKGPGGRGEVEVAISGVVDQSKEVSGPHSSAQISKGGFGIGTFFRRAASVASVAAKHAYAAAAATRSTDEELLPLKCCLMSISLPWEHIAYDLLFKGSPPVNL